MPVKPRPFRKGDVMSRTTLTTFKTLALVAAAGAALSACVVQPYPYRYHQAAYVAPAPVVAGNPNGDYAPNDEVIVDVAPPPPYAEVVPVMPFAGAVWIGGYWGWSGGRHVWIGGRWEHPRPGYYWAPHRWVATGGRWHLVGGGWRAR